MTNVITRSVWTGTRGIQDSGLPDDWEEAQAQLGKSDHSQSHFDYTPTVVERAWAWLIKTFGDEAAHADLSVRFVVELYLES